MTPTNFFIMKIDQDNSYEHLRDVCASRMAVDTLLISQTSDDKKKEEYQRDFDNHKFYDV